VKDKAIESVVTLCIFQTPDEQLNALQLASTDRFTPFWQPVVFHSC